MLTARGTVLALALSFAALSGVTGCSAQSSDAEDAGGSGELGASSDAVSEVVSGPAAVDTDAEVWSVENQWADKTTAAAKKGGVAWGENSGLSWEEKYQKWIGSFEKIPAANGWSQTIRITTPWGKKMDGPVLECADTAIWLRMTFASWYHLPFYLAGYSNGKMMYMGHFGVVDKDGRPWPGFPKFRAQYKDYEKSYSSGDRWPADPRLASRHVGSDDGEDGVDVGGKKLTESDGAGAYYDQLFLNKRAGYLMIMLDGYFGSGNLADGVNMFHVKPEKIEPGDALLERWAKEGIGHTLPVMSVDAPKPNRLRVTVASGSMPRRQAVWEDAGQSAHYFEQDNTGGEGQSYDGAAYASLGGGLRRWRTPVKSGGRWQNIVAQADRDAYIPDSDLADIAARPARFTQLLASDSPEEDRDAALAIIQSARNNLRQYPASCSSRTKREEGFDLLYEAMQKLGKDKSAVDAEYRKLEDFVFAELDYNTSKTCCWDSSTSAMADIVVDYGEKEKAANDAAGVCKQPTVFAAHGGGYDLWKQHASEMGRAADWKAWSEDEPCAQRDVQDDKLGAHDVAMCR